MKGTRPLDTHEIRKVADYFDGTLNADIISRSSKKNRQLAKSLGLDKPPQKSFRESPTGFHFL